MPPSNMHMITFLRPLTLFVATLLSASSLAPLVAQNAETGAPANRERLNFDSAWRFAIGHATDRDKDFDAANSFPFNYFAKTGSAVRRCVAQFRRSRLARTRLAARLGGGSAVQRARQQ